MAYESVILVDQGDNMIGTMEKMAAHRSGRLHRAISVFVFNEQGEMLLQQRAQIKYHSGGEWSNTCCSHPRPGEKTIDAAKRRLKEEMGLVCSLEYAFSFTYRVCLQNGLFEHEYDHVFFGTTDDTPAPNPLEVENFIYLPMGEIEVSLAQKPEVYTFWFRICFERVMEHFNMQEYD